MTEGSIEVKLPTIWTDEKQRWEEAKKKVREEKKRRKKIKEGKVGKKKVQVREKVGKPRHIVSLPAIYGSIRSRIKLAKAAGGELSG